MTVAVKYPVAQISVFFWIGFMGAISFMEAWLKFQAPGITVPLGLGIGKLVFGALNIMEWVFAIIILANLFFSKEKFFAPKDIYFFLPVVLLMLQSIWLLPALDARAELIISGANVPGSILHFYYVGMEIIKIVCLFVFGIKLYEKT
ncbi:MAG TPA: hypothetical protein VFI78_07965 [Salinimicrobium sp.]|nr:hypothetical protein [Salinimicrobium sp.]